MTVPYRSNLLIMASASGYSASTGLGTASIAIYGYTGWTQGSYYYFNTTYDHRTFPTAVFTPGAYSAGSYTVGCLLNCTTDTNDQASFMIVGTKAT